MASLASAIWDGFRHPRALLWHWTSRSAGGARDERSGQALAASTHEANSPERLERIVAYARRGHSNPIWNPPPACLWCRSTFRPSEDWQGGAWHQMVLWH
jgi:hypothetical protein